MKKTTKVVLSVFAIAIASVFVSEYSSSANGNNSKPPTKTSGSPADNNCSNCHGSATTSYTTSVTSNIPSSGYISGQTYTVSVYVNAGTSKRFGFECSPQTTSATRTIIGSVAAIGTDQVNGTGYISHNGGQVGNSYTWQFKWTAPGSATQTAANATGNKGNGNFYASILIANNNGNNDSGDHSQQTNTALTENTTVSVVIAASATTVCAGSSVTFTATPTNEGAGPTYQWKVNGSNVGTNSATYTTSSLNNGDAVTCVLTSNKTGVTGSPATSNSITMTVNATPTITGTTPASRCDAGTVVLGATASSGTVNWYAGSSGGSSVYIGTSYTTTSISSTTTYYVDATDNGCTSTPRTAITATVNNSPSVPTAGSNSPVCEGGNILLNSSSTSGATYQWSGPNSFTSTSQNPAIGSATQAMAGTYSVTASQNGCTSAAGTTNVVVNAPATPSVSIAVTAGSNTTCSGQSITFTASPTNGGSSPAYQWLVNSAAAPGTNNGSTYTYNNFNNNDTVTCVLTSNATCITTAVDTSNAIVITITPKVAPLVSIAVTGGSNPSCNGQNVTFTASPTNGGASPSYQWQLNGVNVGVNQNTYSNSALVTNDQVRCILTSNANCLTTTVDTSAAITMTVNSSLVPTVSIATSSGSTTICQGQSVQFDATPTNGGSAPGYQWQLNGSNVGTNSATYTNSAITNGQQISCTMTSSSGCASPTTAASNTLTMVVTPTVTPSVTITGLSSVCAGTTVTYTASATNQGSNPDYNWLINGASIQTGSSATFSSSGLANNDAVTCILTPAAATCANPSTVSSNTITVAVTPVANPSASIAITGGSNPSCTGQAVTFSVTITDGGSTPAYKWKLNGVNAPGTNNGITYTSSTLATNDTITCVLTSNAACASSSVVTSNKIGMTVTSAFTPSLTISGANSVCEGQAVTFTANPYGGGSTPSYQWQIDGSPAGTNSATYGPITLINGQTITCNMTSSSSCASPTTASSNTLTMVVTPTVAPSVTVSGSNTTCAGTAITFTASPTNEGSSPSYQWKLNGSPVGTSSATYTSLTNITNGSIITCILTSNAACASPTTATATPVTVSVTPVVHPSAFLNFQAGSNPRCSSDALTFQALPTQGGTSPSYQWQVNDNPAPGATNSDLYTPSSLNNDDLVTCVMTSNAMCASSATVSSSVTMTVTTAVTPVVTITTSSTTVDAGSLVTFTATPTYGGATPTYQWKLDGVFTGGASSATFSTSSLTNGQVISCVLTSDYSCITQATANSNNITMVITPTASPAPPTILQTTTDGGVILTSNAATGNQWYYNGVAISGATGQTYTATQNGVYYVVVTNSSSITSQSIPVGIAVPVTIAQNDTLLTSSSATGNQWYLDGVAIPDSTGQNIIATQNGYYSVVVTINGVSSSSATPVLINSFSSSLSPTTGINQITGNNTVTISPSPNDGNFKISFNVTATATYNLEIRNMLGQLVYGETLVNIAGTYDKQISLSGYGKGIYIISLTSPTFKITNNVVVY